MYQPKVEAGDADAMTGSNSQDALVPRCCTLSGFAHEAGCSDGIAIQSLAPGTTLMVQTRNSLYRLIMMMGARHGRARAGRVAFPEATPAHLQGASAGGCLVKTGWIGVGLRVELWVGSNRILTSTVRSIAIENVPPRDSPFQHDA